MGTEKKKRQEGEMFREIAKGLGTVGYELSGTGAKDRAKAIKEKQEAREAKAEKKREVRGVDSWDYTQKEMKKNPGRLIDYKNPTEGDYKKGGSVNENKMMKKMGRGLTKAAMQKVASKVVKGHEKRMHKKYEGGGSVSARADGIAMKGKTRGRMV